MKTIIRNANNNNSSIQKNDYLNKFLIKSRNLQNNSGIIGKLLQINRWQPNE
jgi:hypothetical protein